MSKQTGHPSAREGGRARALARLAGALIVMGPAAGWAWGQDDSGAAPDVPRATGKPSVPASPPVESLQPFEGRAIREIGLTGLKRVDEGLVRNSLRSRVGQPLAVESVREDIQRLNRLGRFREINATAQSFDDQSVALNFALRETPVIADVQVVGNRQISDQDIAAQVTLLANTPVDRFQLDRSVRKIEELYRKKGYYLAQVRVDEAQLEETGIVLFRIREGDRVKVTDIRFEGNRAFEPREIRPVLKSKISGLFQLGPLDDEVLDQDVAAVVQFHKDRGYLDVRADRRVTPAPNGREAIVTFLIDEGPLYTLRRVRAELDEGQGRPGGEAPTVFSVEQLMGLMSIKPGDAYSADKIRKSVEAVRDAYGRLGYADARVERVEIRDTAQPQVDLLLIIFEGRAFKTGSVTIKGNDLTQQKVIRRQVKVYPDRPLDTTALRQTQRNLQELNLFDLRDPQGVKVTIQPPAPDDPEHRDVLVEVKETNTGSLNFGAAVSSDAGVAGIINLNQRNFDLFDVPDSPSEMVSGRAFRGAGQSLSISLSPGTELSTYAVSLGEPYLFETDFSGSGTFAYRQRKFEQYDEDRLGGSLALGRRFGEIWAASVTGRGENVNIRNIDADAPTDVFDFKGDDLITGLGLVVTRTTTDTRFRPSKGTRMEMGVERVGVFGGAFDFTKVSAEHVLFLTVNEDFLGLRTIFSLKTAASYIPDDKKGVPIYERYYLGGRTFRGFRFRTISPKGIRNDTGTRGDDPVGGTWAFTISPQIEQPIFGETFSMVAFADTGTVQDEVGFDQYRVSLGVGLRLYIQALSQAPLAFDFGFPVIKEFGDRERVFSFSLDIPF
ncbi:MAG: BamA/TamA family outer membrane protein [Phycisphaerae bacterium]|nr:BamA/TamA family outer membrane protein [Phycisphaerae bacterium]